MQKYKKNKFLLDSGSPGQTLIETIVGIGLLTTGIVGGMALAIYSISVSDYSLKQITATNLAREGVDVIRNMRDTNWLRDNLVTSTQCDFIAQGQPCYERWELGAPVGGFNINGTPEGRFYIISFIPFPPGWQNTFVTLPTCQTRLYQQTDGSFSVRDAAACINDNNNTFYRLINITRDTSGFFSVQNPRLVVRSEVWWKGKRCPTPSDSPPAGNVCKVTIEEYLTNWKNY